MTIATVRLAVSTVSAILAFVAWTAPILAQSPGLPGPARPQSGAGQTAPSPGMASAPPRDPSARPTPQKGTGVISGRVVALDSGLPLRRARVMLFAGGQGRAAMTDADGAFTFSQVPAGRCDVHASKPRYLDTPYGARRPAGSGKPLELAEGQKVEGLLLTLAPAGVITGRIFDDAGEVVAGVNIAPMRYRSVNGARHLTPFGRQHQTDDTGTFRIFGLPPGKYYLSARVDEGRYIGDVVDPDATGYAPTFYPGTAVAAEAQPIEVVAGAEVVADLQIVTARLTTVTGIVVDPAGALATGGYMMVSGSTGGGRFSSTSGQIKPDGSFTVTGIAPGEYTLIAQPLFGATSMLEPDVVNNTRRRAAYFPIVASGATIAGLRLVVRDPIRIPVNVTFEDGGADRPGRVLVTADSEHSMVHDQAIPRDGKLALEVVPGAYRLSAGIMMMGDPTMGLPATASQQQWFVKRLSSRGHDIDGEVVELTAEPGGRVDVVLTTRTSHVEGVVTGDSGKTAADCMVVVVPEDSVALRRGGLSRLRVARPDAQGRFRVEHIPPGEYRAAAIPEAPIDDIEDVDFVDGVRRAGKAFTLGEGATANIALKLTAVP